MSKQHDAVRFGTALVLAGCLATALACQTNTGTFLDKKATQGAVLGTLAGAAAGAAIDGDKPGRGALIGAAAGGLTGAGIGYYLDRQAQELDAIPDANVQRQDDTLLVLFPGDLLFDVNSTSVSPGAYERLRTVAASMRRYPDTNIVVKGHTDSTGEASYNQRLSEERADNVRKLLVAEGVASYRVTAIGMGENFPLATNSTQAGRQQNRRVEIEIRPNDELREREASSQY